MAITLHTDITTPLPEQTEETLGHKRDEFQVAVDKDIEALKLATAKAGWPDHDPRKLFHRYVVDANDAVALKGVIRRAAILHKVDLTWYKDAKTEAGHVVVKFHTDRKMGKDGKPVKDDALNADGTLKATVKPATGTEAVK